MKPRAFFRKFRESLVALASSGETSMTLLIECGAGKSTIPPAAAYDLSRMGLIDALVWLTPRTGLVRQSEAAMNCADPAEGFIWRQLLGVPDSEARKFQINGLIDGNPKAGLDPSRGSFGYAASFNAVAANDPLHMSFLESRRCLVVADEVQLCEAGSSFGKMLEDVKKRAAFFIAMSGDYDRPGRTDVAGVAYVPHENGRGHGCRKVETNLEYNIYEALQDRAIIPLEFSYGKGAVGFAIDGKEYEFNSFEEVPGQFQDHARWAAVSEGYGDALLAECVQSWRTHRRVGIVRPGKRPKPAQPRAQLLVVCGTQLQAERIHRLLIEQHGVPSSRCALAISDNDSGDDDLERFKRGECDAAVTVAKAYIGMNAKRISHLCCLTHYRSASWLHQMIARAWRLSPDIEDYYDQYAVCFCPKDALFTKAIEHISRAIQMGAIDHAEREGGGSGGPAECAARDHWATLDHTEQRYEIVTENPWLDDEHEYSEPEVSVLIAEPDAQSLREVLLNQGVESRKVEAMIQAFMADPVDPLTDSRTPRERCKGLADELHAYQNATTRMWRGRRAVGKDYAYVNSKLEDLTGWSREKVKNDEDKLRHCLNVAAPALRRRLLGND